MKITLQDFLISQPNCPKVSSTDYFYVDLANKLYNLISETGFAESMPEALVRKVALSLTDYMQDIISDAGLWRSFITANRQLYGYTVPFFETSDSYIDFELNREDVRFLVWYVISMLWEEKRFIYPYNENLLEIADKSFEMLDKIYDEAPLPEDYNISRGLSFKDIEDRDKIVRLGNWIFLHSYLMTPAFATSMRDLASDISADDPDFSLKLSKRLEESMLNDTTGPLALFTPEWVYVMLEGKMPPENIQEKGSPHKFYKLFTDYTGGKEVLFFDSYNALNEFFINALGWEKNEEHLSHVKGQKDYILMVNKDKGMLMAINIARCIKCEDNPLYDETYALKNSFSLLCQRGVCPGDLLKVILKNKWLPDAHFPDNDNFEFVNKYADFLARTYLQLYYRGD